MSAENQGWTINASKLIRIRHDGDEFMKILLALTTLNEQDDSNDEKWRKETNLPHAQLRRIVASHI